MTFGTLLRLGRVSNLPTVITNAMAGFSLSTMYLLPWDPLRSVDPIHALNGLLLVMLALSLFYVGGMYLNDAFDADIDAAERANRPIPTGEISRSAVYVLGFGMLGAGVLISFYLNATAGIVGVALALSVVLYDWLHKRVSYGPVLMGLCRFLSLALAASVAFGMSNAALLGATALLAHTVGLTYTAKQEAYDRIGNTWPLAVMALPVLIVAWMNLQWGEVTGWVFLLAYVGWTLRCLWLLKRRAPGDVPKAVVGLIAGIALLDAALMGAIGPAAFFGTPFAVVAVGLFGLTLLLQRRIAGT